MITFHVMGHPRANLTYEDTLEQWDTQFREEGSEKNLNKVDPRNTALRWGALVSRRVYFVPWPNSLWHLDGHDSLIRWGFIIHGYTVYITDHIQGQQSFNHTLFKSVSDPVLYRLARNYVPCLAATLGIGPIG